MTDTPGTLERLRAAIVAATPDAADAEWTRLLAEAMNAANEIASLRAALTEIAHETRRQQLPITALVNELARQALKDSDNAE